MNKKSKEVILSLLLEEIDDREQSFETDEVYLKELRNAIIDLNKEVVE